MVWSCMYIFIMVCFCPPPHKNSQRVTNFKARFVRRAEGNLEPSLDPPLSLTAYFCYFWKEKDPLIHLNIQFLIFGPIPYHLIILWLSWFSWAKSFFFLLVGIPSPTSPKNVFPEWDPLPSRLQIFSDFPNISNIPKGSRHQKNYILSGHVG